MSERFAHYRVLGLIGEGAMGAVYRAVDDNLRMEVAIKRLSPSLVSDPENLARFEQEARAAANLKHPHIAHVFFVGRSPQNEPFYAMEFIDGPSLAHVIKTRTIMSGAQMLTLMQQTASALAFAAEKGVLHRDVKPGNIMISTEGGAKLVDFGMAKLADTESNLTASGIALGTPNYISPEQARGEAIDYHADMYSLGVTFYELLCGKTPFSAETPVGVIMKHVREAVPPLLGMNAQYPRGLVKLIERMLAKRAVERPPTFAAVLSELESVARQEPGFLRSQWCYCEPCGTNTSLDDQGRVCTLCGAAVKPMPVEEIIVSVTLVGFDTPEARNKIAAYLNATTQRGMEAVLRLLDNLPFLLAPRLPQDRARILQQKLIRLGGRVQTTKVGVRLLESAPTRPILTLPTPKFSTRAFGLGSSARSRAQANAPLFPRRTLFLAALLVAVASGAGAHALFSSHWLERPPIDDQIAIAQAPPTLPHVQEAASSTPSREFTSAYGNCRLTTLGTLPEALPAAVLEWCERLLFEVKDKGGLYESQPLTITLDARRSMGATPFVAAFAARTGNGVFRLPAKGLTAPDELFLDTLTLTIAIHLLTPNGPSLCPPPLLTGTALASMMRVRPGRYQPETLLNHKVPYADEESWQEALVISDARALAQAAVFADQLAKSHDLSVLFKVIRQSKTAAVCEQAFGRSFGGTPHELFANWVVQNAKR